MSMTEEAAKDLRKAFEPSQIGKVPRKGTNGLDYVGHAAVTERLLTVDPEWTWEPVAFDIDGAPLIRYDAKNATLWIRLTVCGVTRYGVGSVMLTAFDVEKQLIGDALRNAAMRFGVALDLWSKQDLHDVANPPPDRVVTTSADLGDLDSMRPGALNDALRDLGLPLGGTPEEMRARLREITGEPSPGNGPTGDDGEVAASPVLSGSDMAGGAVSLPLIPDEGRGVNATTGDGPHSADQRPDPRGYALWPKLDLLAECASREIEMPKSATNERMVTALRVWDQTYAPDAVEPTERPF